jgi:hypothetical protein
MEHSGKDVQNKTTQGNQEEKQLETDTAKIVRRHLADKNDVITDEDIRNVQISSDLPPFNEVTTGAEAATRVIEEEEEKPSGRPATPWDTVEQ